MTRRIRTCLEEGPEGFDGMLAVLVEQQDELVSVLFCERVDDQGVFMFHPPAIQFRTVVDEPVGICRVPEDLDHALQARHPGCLQDHEMELPVRLRHREQVTCSARSLDIARDGSQSFQNAPARFLRQGHPRSFRFKELPDSVDLEEVDEGEGCHLVAPVGFVVDLPLGLEDLECFTEWDTADTETFRERILAEGLPGEELTRDDRSSEFCEHEGLRGRRAFRTRRGVAAHETGPLTSALIVAILAPRAPDRGRGFEELPQQRENRVEVLREVVERG